MAYSWWQGKGANSPLQSLIALELLPTNLRDMRRQIIRFIQYMAKMLKRRERHIPLRS